MITGAGGHGDLRPLSDVLSSPGGADAGGLTGGDEGWISSPEQTDGASFKLWTWKHKHVTANSPFTKLNKP